ncbi:MAG: dynamin family protein [Acidimicrobiales bacterium]
MTLTDRVRGLLSEAAVVTAGTPDAVLIREAQERLDAPLRVALAGRVKAGKSTLLNALIGEELAPTDAAECTRLVTWYRDAPSYGVTVVSRGGGATPARFARNGGPLEIELPEALDMIERIEVQWPSASLREMTLIDTPGLGSISVETSERARRFLQGENAEPAAADAVVYLLRHMHAADIDFLEAFRDDIGRPAPVNAIAVLSRADEIGVARPDALESASRIAGRLREDVRLRRLVQTVVPVAGLLAQASITLRQDEFTALAMIASTHEELRAQLLLSADDFTTDDQPTALTPAERHHLLVRLGLFGVRLAVDLIASQQVDSAPALAGALVSASGLPQMQETVRRLFGARASILKAHTALGVVEAAAARIESGAARHLEERLEALRAGVHEFDEVRVVDALRSGQVSFGPDDNNRAEQILGGDGGAGPAGRLGLQDDADSAQLRSAWVAEVAAWRRRAENPLSSREVAAAARVVARTCEGLLQTLDRSDKGEYNR